MDAARTWVVVGSETEHDLWARSLKGDGEAFGVLFDRHHPVVFRRALYLAGERGAAKDVVATAFLTASMDPLFAASLRQELVDQVRSAKRRRRSWRIGGAVAGVVLAGTGAGAVAVATSQEPIPGADRVEVVKAGARVDGTGTRTVDLGDAPKGATDIEVVLICRGAGSYAVVDVFSGTCSDLDAKKANAVSFWKPVRTGDNRLIVQAGPGARWTLTASFARRTRTKFGVNADGKTFGAGTGQRTPDLVAVDNGQVKGYVYAKDLKGPMPKNPAEAAHWNRTHGGRRVIPIYSSDGHTVIGPFVIG